MNPRDGARAVAIPVLRLLQLASPALPIGAYSYSSGLETAIEEGRVGDPQQAFDWIADAVTLILGRFDAPLLAAAVAAAVAGDGARLAELDALAIASRETAELRLESEQMGYSLGQWMTQVLDEGAATPIARPAVRSAPVAWALAAARLGLDAELAVTAWLWGFVENQAMVLIKALPMGQIQGQRLLLRLGPVVAAAAAQAVRLGPEAWSNASAGLAIASMRHERQYSRLFRS